MDLFENLFDNQIEAVKTIDEDLEIIACAGAGKIGVVTRRIINILKSNPEKKRILVSTNDSDINKAISIFSRYELDEFSNRKETLEDYFMKFYKEEKDFKKGAL